MNGFSIRRVKGTGVALCCAVAIGMATAGSASAAVDVNSFADDGSGGCTLREAVGSANQNTSVGGCADPAAAWSEIALDPGTYTLAGAAGEDLNAGGDLDVSGTLRIVGEGASATTINGANNDRVIDVVGPTSNLLLDSLRILDGNAAADGGGVQMLNGDLNVSEVSFESNHTDSDGGAVKSNGAVQVGFSSVVGNSADGDGGAFELSGANTEIIFRSLVAGNSAGPGVADHGGAIDAFSSASIDIQNSTLSGNSAGGAGAVYVDANAGDDSVFKFVTVAGNSSSGITAGGIFVSSGRTMSVRTSILAGNTSSTGPSNCGGAGTVVPSTPEGFMIESANTCGFDPTAGNQVNTDPQLAPLADNGGPTLTRALYVGSPAVDAVPTSECALANPDQRDFLRPVGGACDIGAFEGSIPRPPSAVPPASPATAPTPAAKRCPKGKKLVKKNGKRKCVRKKKKNRS